MRRITGRRKKNKKNKNKTKNNKDRKGITKRRILKTGVWGEKGGKTSEIAEKMAFWGILSQTKHQHQKDQNKSKC